MHERTTAITPLWFAALISIVTYPSRRDDADFYREQEERLAGLR
jgi:hypothetical protein